MHDPGVAPDDVLALLQGDHGVLEKAAGVAYHGRVGQLGAANGADPIKHGLRIGCGDAGLVHPAFEFQVAQHRPPGARQGKSHPRDHPLAGQLVLEDAVAIAKLAARRIEGDTSSGDQIDDIERMEAVLQLNAIGADVLYRRGAYRTGNQRQVLQPGQPLSQGPGHRVVPVLARTGLDDPGLGPGFDQAQAAHLDLQHHRIGVAGENDVAAAAEDEFRRAPEFRVIDDPAQRRVAVDAHQRVRGGGQAETVERAQVHAALDRQRGC